MRPCSAKLSKFYDFPRLNYSTTRFYRKELQYEYYSKYLEGANNDYIIDKADFPPMSFEP